MKKFCIIVLVCIIVLPGITFASDHGQIDISGLSVQQLIFLKERINLRLLDIGVYPFISLERGDKGEEVARLQERLIELGYLTFEATGKYDNNTQLAQKRYEKENQLEQDGRASLDDQNILFSEHAVPFSTPTPKPTELPTETPDPIRSQYKAIDYEEYARFPEKYYMQKVFLKGKVEQVLGSRETGFQIRFSVLNNSNNIVYVFINNDPGYNILEGDRLLIYATLSNTISYKSIWNQTIVIPAAIAEILELL